MYHLLNTKGPDGAARAGIAVDGAVFDLEKIMGPVTTIGLVADWETQAPRLEAIANKAAEGGHQDTATGPVAEAGADHAATLFPRAAAMRSKTWR